MENNILLLVDKKKEIKFWIEALSNNNINSKNKELINKALEQELIAYVEPPVTFKINTIKLKNPYDAVKLSNMMTGKPL